MDKARADYIIGELARKPGKRPLVILMTSTHPMTDKNLCKTGHQFYNLDIPQFPIKWQNEEQVPENMHIIKSLNELPHRPDLIISQNIVDQYNTWIQFGGLFDRPVLGFEHTLPTDAWKQQGIPTKLANDLDAITRVFITDFSRKEWECEERERAHTLYHMVDTDKFSKWEGGNGKAMLLVNSFAGREWAVGDIDAILAYDAKTAPQEQHDQPPQPRLQLFGVNPGYHSPALKGQQVVQQLREHDVFVNASVKSPIPASLLEAAAVGMPIVTTATCAIPKFFTDGVNCLVYDGTPEDCLKKVDQLLGDRKLRKRLGAAARETVLEHFNEERYVKDWNEIFEAAMERFNG
jgi:hypothetical protein